MARNALALFCTAAAVMLLAPAFGPKPAVADHREKAEMNERVLRHVVLFKFKEDADPAGIKAAEEAFAALPSKIDAIHELEWGTNNSPEDLAQGYTHCFLVTFKSEEDRAKYLPHPAHKAFVEVLKPVIDEVHVIDYWTK